MPEIYDVLPQRRGMIPMAHVCGTGLLVLMVSAGRAGKHSGVLQSLFFLFFLLQQAQVVWSRMLKKETLEDKVVLCCRRNNSTSL